MGDDTFLEAHVLDSHGSCDAPDTYCRLLRWKFKMPMPFSNREMLYLAVPIQLDQEDAVAVCYLSVESPLYPLSSGYTRAYNCVPSFDLGVKHPKGDLTIRHTMTTRLGGWVQDWLWNACFFSPVIENMRPEASHVRDFLGRSSEQSQFLDIASPPKASSSGTRKLLAGLGVLVCFLLMQRLHKRNGYR